MDQNIFLRMNTGAHTSAMGGFLVTSDRSQLVSMSVDKTIRVWDPISQREMRQFRGRIGRGNDGGLSDIALTPNDQYLLSAVRSDKDDGFNLRIFDFKSGELVKTLGVWGAIGIHFSADQRFMLITDYYNKRIEIYDYHKFLETLELDNSAPLHTIGFGDILGNPRPLCFFQVGESYRLLVAMEEFGSNQHSLLLVEFDADLSDIKQTKHIETPDYLVEFAAENGTHIVTSDNRRQIVVRDFDFNVVTQFEATSHPYTLRFSPDGTMLLAGYAGENGACIVYDATVANYAPLSHFFGHQSTSNATAFLNNQTAVTGGGSNNEIYFWTPQTGEVRGHITGAGETVFAVGLHDNLLAFGNTQAFKLDQNNFAPLERVVDLNSFDIFSIDELDDIEFRRVRPTQGDRKIEVRNANLWMNDVPLSGNNEAHESGHWFFSASYGFTDDGLVLVGEGRDGRIYACHVDESQGWAGATFIALLRGHTGDIWDMAVQGNRLVTCGTDQIIRIWDLDDIPRPQSAEDIAEFKKKHPFHAHPVDPLLQMFFTKDGEWIIWSKSGFYDASLNGDRFVGFHVNRGDDQAADFYTSDRFAHTLFRPDVIREIIKVGSEEQVLQKFGLADINIEDILPPTIIFAGDTSQAVDEGTFPLEFRVTHPQDQPLSKVWILINEIPVWEWDAAEPGKLDPSMDEIVFKLDDLLLTPGANKIKIMARTVLSQSNPLEIDVFSRLDEVDEESRGTQSAVTNKIRRIQPNLYLLSVGVSKYKHGQNRVKGKKSEAGVLYNLNFAEKDADGIGQIFQELKGESFAKVDATVLTDARATKTSIEKAVKALGTKIEERAREKRQNKQVARDVVVIFMAGHGVKINGDFYFMSHEAKPGSVKTTSVKMLDIGKVINDYKAEIVMLTDACHSGQIGDNFNNRELTKSWKEINGRAQVIFSATTADRVSVEHSDWGHGAFTRGILDVINENKERWMLQFFPDVSNTVRSITNPRGAGKGKSRQMQKPTLTILGVMSDFRLKRINRR